MNQMRESAAALLQAASWRIRAARGARAAVVAFALCGVLGSVAAALPNGPDGSLCSVAGLVLLVVVAAGAAGRRVNQRRLALLLDRWMKLDCALITALDRVAENDPWSQLVRSRVGLAVSEASVQRLVPLLPARPFLLIAATGVVGWLVVAITSGTVGALPARLLQPTAAVVPAQQFAIATRLLREAETAIASPERRGRVAALRGALEQGRIDAAAAALAAERLAVAALSDSAAMALQNGASGPGGEARGGDAARSLRFAAAALDTLAGIMERNPPLPGRRAVGSVPEGGFTATERIEPVTTPGEAGLLAVDEPQPTRGSHQIFIDLPPAPRGGGDHTSAYARTGATAAATATSPHRPEVASAAVGPAFDSVPPGHRETVRRYFIAIQDIGEQPEVHNER